MNLRQAAEMALEDICGAKLCETNSMSSRAEMLRLMDKAAEALRQVLAQKQEPAAAHYKPRYNPIIWPLSIDDKPLDAALTKQWVGLTVEEVLELLPSSEWKADVTLIFAKAIEAKLKEKNT